MNNQNQETECRCGITYYGDTCPNCGTPYTKPTRYATREQAYLAAAWQERQAQANQNQETECRCGITYYGDTCPNCV